MRKRLPILILCLFPVFAFAKSMTCDPQPGVTKIRVIIPSQAIDEISVAQPDGSCLHNIDAWPAGTYSGTIQAGAEYILNGIPQGVMEWSGATPFDLEKPSLSDPSNIGLRE